MRYYHNQQTLLGYVLVPFLGAFLPFVFTVIIGEAI